MTKNVRRALYGAGFVILAVFSGMWIMLAKPVPVNSANPSPSTSTAIPSIPEASQGVGEANQEQLPVTAVAYGSTVKTSGLSVTAANPQTVDFGDSLKTVVAIKVANTGEAFEFETRYGFQFIDGSGTGTLAADTIGFQSVGTGFSRNGEVQVDAVNDNFKNGKLLLIDRSTGMPVGAWK